jgi:hypothetical protein
MQTTHQPIDRAGIALGILVLVAGVLLLAAQLVRFELPGDAWPYVIIVPGVAMLVVGLVFGSVAGTGLCVAGSIVTAVGLILLYQNATTNWESWAYAWALIPTAAGTGLLLSGLVNREGSLVRAGTNLVLVGGALFVAGLVFFEGVIGLSGNRPELLSNGLLPAILVGVGILLVARSVLFPARPAEGGGDSTRVSSAMDQPGPGGTAGPAPA